MKILIKNCNLISVDKKREQIEENIDILIEDDVIKKIDKEINTSVDKVIDATNKVVLPGLINAHAHIPMSIFRETISDLNLQDWLNKKIWPMEEKLTKEDIYYSSYLTFLEAIRTGTTTINDMYFTTDPIIEARNKTGVRLQTTQNLMDRKGEEAAQYNLNELQRLINENQENDMVTFNAGIHGMYTSSSQYIDRCIELAKKNNIPIHMHFLENSQEIKDIENLHNKKPLDLLKEKYYDTKTLLAHCVKLTEKDIDEIKNMNLSIVTCPISNLKLGCGIPKINYMHESGINVCLGTDGQGTGSNLDLFEVMKYTALLQKGILEDCTKMKSYDIIKMATINGAKALGLEEEIGSIEENKKADIIIIDMDTLLTNPKNDLISQIVYNTKGSDVDTTIINGQILMENKRILNQNEKEIIKKCEKIYTRISEGI